MARKIIRLTESDLTMIVKKVISEQKKFDLMIRPGQTLEANLKNGIMTLRSEMGNTQSFKVKAGLPDGDFMFEYGRDKKYYGYHPKTGRKTEILIFEKIK